MIANGNTPASPVECSWHIDEIRGLQTGNQSGWATGLTKREAFAMAAMQLQPGVAEIVTAAGLRCPDGHSVWSDDRTKVGTFSEWWSALTNEARFALVAKVQTTHADALLAELEKQP